MTEQRETSLPIVTELARWEVVSDELRIVVRYGQDAAGQYRVEYEGDHAGMIEFLEYYLDDPLNGHPVYLHGLGYRRGPHTADLEQFEEAMAILPFNFPSYRTSRL